MVVSREGCVFNKKSSILPVAAMGPSKRNNRREILRREGREGSSSRFSSFKVIGIAGSLVVGETEGKGVVKGSLDP